MMSNSVALKLERLEIAAGTISFNTERLRQLAQDIRATTDCDAIRLKLGITNSELQDIAAGLMEEAAELLKKYVPILNLPTNPKKIIGWAKKLLLGSIHPQLEAYIKILKQLIEMAEVSAEVIEAIQEVMPRLEQCINEIKSDVSATITNTETDILAKVNAKINEIRSDIAQSIDFESIVGVLETIESYRIILDGLQSETDSLDSNISLMLGNVQSVGDSISGLTGIPFSVDTTDANSFTASATSLSEFQNSVSTYLNNPAPVNSALPEIVGTAIVGETLTSTEGTWVGDSITYTYQWNRAGIELPGATDDAYIVTASDIGYVLSCSVSADNSGGGVVSTTAETDSVVSNAPSYTVAPAITGSPQVSGVLSVSTGTWDGSPPTLAYQWQWAHTGANITGATSSVYTVDLEDLARTITCVVTASAPGGSTSYKCVATTVVVP
jgi:hypothetical protein